MLVIIKTVIALIGTVLLVFAQCANANFGVAVSSGQGIMGITPVRLAVSWDFGPIWREDELWGMNIFLETSAAMWNGPSRAELSSERAKDLQLVTSGPVLRWQRWEPLSSSRIIPYAELGIGLSWLSETEIQGRVLSLHFQFEDKAGVGIRFGKNSQYDLALRAYHYSNASIQRPNSGVNLFMASLGVWFSK
jgi:lipid A 3-O-deacylase